MWKQFGVSCRKTRARRGLQWIDEVSAISKRMFDLMGAVIGLALLSPLFIAVAIAIKLDSRGPVFFRQTRVGRIGVLFQIFKFRTMRTAQHSDALGITTADDARITRIGSFLRNYKIDELAQLLNVVRGEMSLVGPRPELPKFVALYPSDIRDIVLSLRPGITDFASIAFKDESSLLAKADDPEQFYIEHVMPKKLDAYVRYVREQSLILDIRLIFLTLARIWS